MADACNPKNLTATVSAYNQSRGRDIFTEAERYNQFNAAQTAQYERFMAGTFGINPKNYNKPSSWDALPKYKAETLADRAEYSPPSEVLAGKFWDSVNSRLSKWEKGKADLESYKKEIAPIARNTLKAIDNIVKTKKGANLDRELSKLGLRQETVYEAKNYLEWLRDGGHLQGSGNAKWLTDKASQIARAQASFNLTWTLGNGVDAIRIASNYAVSPKALIEGTVRSLQGNPFSKNKRFDSMGIYGTQRAEVNPNAGKFDPFNRSIIAQKNWVAHIEEARGGNIEEGIRKNLFDSKPWDKPRGERFQGGDLIFGLGRYAINETRWIYKTTHQSLNGDREAATRLATYLVSRVALTGVPAQVPDAIYRSLPKEWKDGLEQIDKRFGLNLVKTVSNQAFKSVGLDAEIDISDYIRPGGGSLGARAKSLVDNAQNIATSGAKSAVNLSQGKVLPAAVNTLATAFAMANYGVLASSANKLGKGVQIAEKLEGGGANSTTITNVLKSIAGGLEKEFSSEQWALETAKAALGRNNVKKANND